MADINNERIPRNESYKTNLLKLQNLILVKFLNETIVEPKETEWFEFYKEGSSKVIVPLEASAIYKEDWIGLKELDQSKRLKMLAVEGDHLQFKWEWFKEQIVNAYLLK